MINLHILMEITSCTLSKIQKIYILMKTFEIDGQFLMMAALLMREMTSLLSKRCKLFYHY